MAGAEQSIAAGLARQFAQPTGVIGSLAGLMMAHRPSNRCRNLWTVSLLDLKPHHRVLEIGFGPGRGIEAAAALVSQGTVAGIDHSEKMLAQASKRNRRHLQSGRAELHLGGLELIAHLQRPFDRIFSANVVQFWNTPASAFRQLFDAAAPNGLIATTYQPRHRGSTSHDAEQMAERIVAWMEEAGFSGIKVKRLPLTPFAVSVLGRRRSI